MALIVQKYGGDALGDKGKGKTDHLNELRGAEFLVEKFQHVARLAVESQKAGNQVVVVVSAMGDTTNRLLRMANALMPEPELRELDMLMATGEQQSIALLAIAISAAGGQGVSFTGPQVGIRTDELFGRSRIKEIHCERLKKAIDEGKIPIVAGFQGASEHDEITTLGRGGSDITAVALAAVLNADCCEFYKDVDGIMTTDPRVCPTARKIDRISYDEMLELASLGAGVLHSRSVEFAKNYRVPLHVRSFLHDKPGTFVIAEEKEMEEVVVSGVAFNRDEARVTLQGLPDKPGVAAEVFSRLGQDDIVVDMIIQNESKEGRNDISFTVGKKDFGRTKKLCELLVKEVGALGYQTDESIAKVSAVGVGMRSHSGVASKMFKALSDAGINIEMIATSEIKISVLIDEKDMEHAVRVIHQAFEPHSSPGASA
ncbi:aspartate kinase [bacterium]|nr:aspartate kinase [bacterium]